MPSPIEPSVRAAHRLDDLGSRSALGPVDEASSHTGTVILEPREPKSPDASWLVKWKRAEKK